MSTVDRTLDRLLARRMGRREVLKLLAVAPIASLVGCAPRGPEPIRYGEAICAHCLMMVSDDRYGASLVTRTGRVHVFDAVECMIAYVNRHPDLEVRAHYVTDFERRGTLIPAETAAYLQSPRLRSPMALNLTSFASETARDDAFEVYGGDRLGWGDLPRVVREARFE